VTNVPNAGATLVDLADWPCGLILAGIDGTLLRSNAYVQELTGCSTEELSQKQFADLLTVAGKLFYETYLIPQLRLQGFVYEIALDIVRNDARVMPVLLNAAVDRGGDDAVPTIHIVIFKAEERRRYEKDLMRARRHAEYLTEVFKYSDDSIILLSPDDRVSSWNESSTRLFGYSSEEALDRRIVDLIVPDDRGDEFRQSRIKLQKGERVHLESVCLHKDRRRIDVSISLTPHLEPPGLLVAYSCVIRDETERKRTAEALLRSEKIASVGRLASSIAHEINNPLEAVMNLMYLIRSDSELTSETRQYVARADQELARIAHVATHTLRFHRQSTHPVSTDLSTLIDSVLALYEGRLRNAGITVYRDYRKAEPLTIFESDVRQVFANLIGNAADAMQRSPQRHLRIRIRPARAWKTGGMGVRVVVADSGVGMDPGTRMRVFEPFYSTKGIGGTGLGLWISKEIVDRHQGQIRVRSQEGRGSAFDVFLPQPEDVSAKSDPVSV
jgi:PAS domain S-box-containing protein